MIQTLYKKSSSFDPFILGLVVVHLIENFRSKESITKSPKFITPTQGKIYETLVQDPIDSVVNDSLTGGDAEDTATLEVLESATSPLIIEGTSATKDSKTDELPSNPLTLEP